MFISDKPKAGHKNISVKAGILLLILVIATSFNPVSQRAEAQFSQHGGGFNYPPTSGGANASCINGLSGTGLVNLTGGGGCETVELTAIDDLDPASAFAANTSFAVRENGETEDNAATGSQVATFIEGQPINITDNSASCFTVGPNGTTNPAFTALCSVASQATGLQVTPAAAGSGLLVDVTSSGTNEALTIQPKGSGTLNIRAANSSGSVVIGIGSSARLTIGGGITIGTAAGQGFGITPTAATSGSNTKFSVVTPTDTGLTASTNVPVVNFNFGGGTATHATGALALQTDFQILRRTHAFSGASTITDAATVYIEGPPLAGTNATITNAWALYAPSGNSYLAGLNVNGGGNITALTAGTYTPTLTNVANLDASTAFECQYSRIGVVVTGSCRVSVDPALTATSTQLGISLSVASNFGAVEDAAGSCFASGIVAQGAAIIADTTNDRLQMQWLSGDVTNQPMTCTFSYQVI